MQLTDVAIELRPRESWEAVDLGQAMWRAWWRQLMAAWSVTFVPMAIGLGVAFHDRLFVALLVLWWLLPLIERGPLYVLGRLVFGERVDARSLLAALPMLMSWRRAWLRITFARLSPWRGFVAPIAVLESQSGAAARRRGRALMASGSESSVALALTFVALAIQVGVAIASMLLIASFLPDSASDKLLDGLSDSMSQERSSWATVVLYIVSALSMSLVGPLYCACSFALYLNRRIYLEGWDIEVAFRSLAQRMAASARRAGAAVALVLGSLVLLANTAPAQDAPAPVSVSVQGPKEVAEEILARPEFSTTRTERRVVEKARSTGAGGGAALDFMSEIARVVFVLIAVAVLAFVIAQIVRLRRLPSDRASGDSRPPPPVEVAGLDVRLESLPVDPAAEALALWRRGATRDALGLLYRAAIARLAHVHLVPIVDGDTEGVCLRRVLSVGERAPGSTFTILTRAWQRCAYGRELPRDDEFDALCTDFRAAFGGAA